jgi:hypothetical protein
VNYLPNPMRPWDQVAESYQFNVANCLPLEKADGALTPQGEAFANFWSAWSRTRMEGSARGRFLQRPERKHCSSEALIRTSGDDRVEEERRAQKERAPRADASLPTRETRPLGRTAMQTPIHQ